MYKGCWGVNLPVHVKMAKRILLAPVAGIILGKQHVAEDDGLVRAGFMGECDEGLGWRVGVVVLGGFLIR